MEAILNYLDINAVNALVGGCTSAGLFLAGVDAKKGESPSFMLKWAGFFFFIFVITS